MIPYSTYGTSTLDEKLILHNGGAKYGQVVFLAGGAGSGKGFALKNFMEGEKFKVIDVDILKKHFLELSKLSDKYPELKGIDLKNPKDVTTLHRWVASRGLKDKIIKGILKDVDPDHLPNLVIDTTLRDLGDIYQWVGYLYYKGYKPTDIHITWVLADYKVALKRNKERERSVPDEVVISTHAGAAMTMAEMIKRAKPPKDIDGEVRIVMSNPGTTTMHDDGKTVKDFQYLVLKKSGQPMVSSDEAKALLYKLMQKNVPKNWQTKDIHDFGKPKKPAPKPVDNWWKKA